MGEGLRVIDFGRVSPLRSQTLWHAVAHGVSAGAGPTLSFARPSAPYVCLGYHRSLGEVDQEACRRRGLPIYRRMVGGGPVYLDGGQLLFQITVPADQVAAARAVALRRLLEPAVAAFRAAGVLAELDADGEIVVGDRKVCGHGAGQIGDAVVVVGNLIERFDHQAAAAILATPSAAARREMVRLMRRFVAATPADADTFRRAAEVAYGEALGLVPRRGGLTPGERARVRQLDRQFCDPRWINGSVRPSRTQWQAKVRAGVSVFASDDVLASIVGGRIDRIRVDRGDPNGVQQSLVGCDLDDVRERLRPFGSAGRRISDVLAVANRSVG